MKLVPKSREHFYTLQVIRARYGRDHIRSKTEKALYSLPAVAKLLKLPFSEVRRLYRQYFQQQKQPSLELEHHQYLTSSETLHQQATLSLKERVEQFQQAFPGSSLSVH